MEHLKNMAATKEILSSLTVEVETLLWALQSASNAEQILALGADVQSSLDTLWQAVEQSDTDLHKAERKASACIIFPMEVTV